MKFLITFFLTVVLLVVGFSALGENRLIQGNVVISTTDSAELIPNPETDDRVMVSYLFGDGGGTTSVRFEKNKITEPNKYPADSVTVYGDRQTYGEKYTQRDRDLGQTFVTGDKGFSVGEVYLRVGPNDVKVNSPGAKVAIEFFQVRGTPRLNNHGTPGFKGQFDRKSAPELDDYLEGESYQPIYVATGQLPAGLQKNQYMKWELQGKPLQLKPNRNYAFMIMFLERETERSLSLYNNYYGKYQPDPTNPYIGHGIRREGKPDFPEAWEKRLHLQPGTVGFPDVCTFRDLFFVMTKSSEQT